MSSCSICHEELIESGQTLYKTECNHLFHKKCIIEWSYYNLTCPLCRAIIPSERVYYTEQCNKVGKLLMMMFTILNITLNIISISDEQHHINIPLCMARIMNWITILLIMLFSERINNRECFLAMALMGEILCMFYSVSIIIQYDIFTDMLIVSQVLIYEDLCIIGGLLLINLLFVMFNFRAINYRLLLRQMTDALLCNWREENTRLIG